MTPMNENKLREFVRVLIIGEYMGLIEEVIETNRFDNVVLKNHIVTWINFLGLMFKLLEFDEFKNINDFKFDGTKIKSDLLTKLTLQEFSYILDVYKNPLKFKGLLYKFSLQTVKILKEKILQSNVRNFLINEFRIDYYGVTEESIIYVSLLYYKKFLCKDNNELKSIEEFLDILSSNSKLIENMNKKIHSLNVYLEVENETHLIIE